MSDNRPDCPYCGAPMRFLGYSAAMRAAHYKCSSSECGKDLHFAEGADLSGGDPLLQPFEFRERERGVRKGGSPMAAPSLRVAKPPDRAQNDR